jgi:hypothetical protein
VQFYMQAGEPQKALRYGSHILEIDHSAFEAVFYLYIKTGFDFQDTLKFGIPWDREVAQSYMSYVIRNGDVAKAEPCWDWVSAHLFADDKLAGEYLSFLIRARESAKAWNAWIEYIGGINTSNLLYNGGFESKLKPSPFDWKISESAAAEVSRESTVIHDGKWALKITFNGRENPTYRNVSQYVFLQPGIYRFKGFMRTEGITTEQGIGFKIGSITTEQLTGTSGWKELDQSLEVREPSLLNVEIFRKPSWKIANKLSGTVWIDDIHLTRSSTP